MYAGVMQQLLYVFFLLIFYGRVRYRENEEKESFYFK
jgi:hypothetical protein